MERREKQRLAMASVLEEVALTTGVDKLRFYWTESKGWVVRFFYFGYRESFHNLRGFEAWKGRRHESHPARWNA